MVPFPEDRFPPPAVLREAYEARVAAGYARLRETRLLIWGLARDLGARLVTNTLPLVESIRALAVQFDAHGTETGVGQAEAELGDDWGGSLGRGGGRTPLGRFDVQPKLGRGKLGELR